MRTIFPRILLRLESDYVIKPTSPFQQSKCYDIELDEVHCTPYKLAHIGKLSSSTLDESAFGDDSQKLNQCPRDLRCYNGKTDLDRIH